MHFDWSTFALQTVNFAVLVWLLQRFLYRPVLRLVEARRVEVDRQYADARAAVADAQVQRAAVKAERDDIAAERAAALRAAAADAEAAAAARRAQAERDATALLEDARKTLADERARALAAARRAALDLGAEIAARLIAEVPARLRAEAWIERIEQHLTALPAAQKEALTQKLDGAAEVRIVTATALPPETAEDWRGRLDRLLGGGIADRLTVAVDPDLVAGVELHFPTAVLRFSWRSALAAMRDEVEADGHAR